MRQAAQMNRFVVGETVYLCPVCLEPEFLCADVAHKTPEARAPYGPRGGLNTMTVTAIDDYSGTITFGSNMVRQIRPPLRDP